jgi:hypothetical protein
MNPKPPDEKSRSKRLRETGDIGPGDHVFLGNGCLAVVEYVSRRMNVARVRTSKDEIRTVMLSALLRFRPSAQLLRAQAPRIIEKVDASSERILMGEPRPIKTTEVERIGKTDPSSHRKIVQPSRSMIENERLAAQAAPVLETRLSRIAGTVPGARFSRLRPQKNPLRIEQKIREGKPADTISDYLAAQLSADTPQAKAHLVQRLRKAFPVIEVDDRFLEGRAEKGGYPSANVQVKLPNKVTAEVQIVPREVQEITDKTHHLYTEARTALDADNKTRARQAFTKAQKLNAKAVDRFKKRNVIRNSH